MLEFWLIMLDELGKDVPGEYYNRWCFHKYAKEDFKDLKMFYFIFNIIYVGR